MLQGNLFRNNLCQLIVYIKYKIVFFIFFFSHPAAIVSTIATRSMIEIIFFLIFFLLCNIVERNTNIKGCSLAHHRMYFNCAAMHQYGISCNRKS